MSDTIWVAVIGLIGLMLNGLILREQSRSKKAQEDAQKRMEIILEGTEASLIGIKQLGANGRVTECLTQLEKYKNCKAAK